jgi:hypothetical protein
MSPLLSVFKPFRRAPMGCTASKSLDDEGMEFGSDCALHTTPKPIEQQLMCFFLCPFEKDTAYVMLFVRPLRPHTTSSKMTLGLGDVSSSRLSKNDIQGLDMSFVRPFWLSYNFFQNRRSTERCLLRFSAISKSHRLLACGACCFDFEPNRAHGDWLGLGLAHTTPKIGGKHLMCFFVCSFGNHDGI